LCHQKGFSRHNHWVSSFVKEIDDILKAESSEDYFPLGLVNVSFSATTGATSFFLMVSVTVMLSVTVVLSVTVFSICSSEEASGLFLQFENNTTENRATKITDFFKKINLLVNN
jgi:hypothetical protein